MTFLILIGGRLLRRVDAYFIHYENVSVSGLEAGAPVKYHGLQIGRVADLSVKNAETIAVRIETRHDTALPRDVEAVLAHMGITGQKYVELEGGTTAAGMLRPGETILAGQSMFQTVSDRAEEMLERTNNVLASLERLLDPSTTEAAQRMLTSLAGVAEQTEGLLVDNRGALTSSMANLDIALSSLAVASARLDSTMTRTGALVQRLDTEVDSMRLAETTAQFRAFVASSNAMVTHGDLLLVQARDDLLRSLANMEEALDNLREATDLIRDNPSVLIRGRPRDAGGFVGEGP